MGAAVVETASGRLRGHLVDGPVPVAAYRGIPFAAAPVGALRLMPPVPARSWAGERDAGACGPIAPQPDSFMTAFGEPQSEDCLLLNVWAPVGAAKAPVMVWFHGGGFTGGSGSTPWYDGTRLATRGVVVVTVNYRLGPLGFLHLEPFGGELFAGSANLGLADQTLALEWVRDHIEAFGGDPHAVTIFGESAGAMSVCAHLARPASKGLFHRAIAQSGAARHARSAAESEEVAAQVLDALGVDRSHPERLRDLPVRAFVDVQSQVSVDLEADVPLAFLPTIEGADLPESPLEAIRGGSAASIDLLIGTTLDEMNLFTVFTHRGDHGSADEARLRRRLGQALERWGRTIGVDEAEARYRHRVAEGEPLAVWSAIATDLVFRVPAIETADAQAQHAEVRMYRYEHPSTGFGGALGAAHAMEVPFVFDNVDAFGVEMLEGPITEERRSFAHRVAEAWVAFAAEGDPSTPALGEWPTYGERRSTMLLDVDHRLEDDPQAAERSVWYP